MRGEIRRIRVDGKDMVVKSASGRGREHLRKEAELLRVLAAPGVPELVALRDGDERTDLVTIDAGRADLSQLRRSTDGFDDSQASAALVDVAEALDVLHLRGWIHGAVCAEHVVVDAHGGDRTATLCSWGSARPATGGDIDAEIDDLRRLCRSTLSSSSMRPVRDIGRRLARRRTLRRLDDDGIGSAAAIAAVLDDSPVPLVVMHRWTPRRPAPPRFRAPWFGGLLDRAPRLPHLGVALSLAVLLGVSTFSMWPRSSVSAAGERPVRLTEPSAGCAHGADGSGIGSPGPSVDLDGDGCAGPIDVDGNVVTADSVRFEVGQTGDQLAVGDWYCDGQIRVRLLHPPTGELFEFDEWAGGSASAEAVLIGRAPGASAAAVRSERGCDHLQLSDAAGAEVVGW